MWAMTRFDGCNFAICGKTIESLRRNVTSNLPVLLAGVFSFKEHRTENKIVVSANGKSNSFYLFGGKDESSAALIQGISDFLAVSSCQRAWNRCRLSIF